MGVREMERFLEQWQMNVKDLHRRLILAPTPRGRERWHANQRRSWMDPIVELLRARSTTARPRAPTRCGPRTPPTSGWWAGATPRS